ncbi:MAG TPA: hypothetical protein VER78_00135 [Thermoanaerobaculia bacterium]|nr:hypothetical protein [Thermoanaerobaculia bacterium]
MSHRARGLRGWPEWGWREQTILIGCVMSFSSSSSDPEASGHRSFPADFFAFIMAGLPFTKRQLQELFHQYRSLMKKDLAFWV